MLLLIEAVETHLEINLVGTEHLAGFTTIAGAYDTGLFELVHDAACSVVSDREFALDE